MVAVPLQVILTTPGRGDRVVTAELLSGLSFSATVPGGFEACNFSVKRALKQAWPETEPFVKCKVIDTSTGLTMWSGRLERPGRTADGSGESFALTAVGPKAHASDNTIPVVYVDQRADQWSLGQVIPTGVTWETIDGSTASQGSRFQYAFPRGTALATSTVLSSRYFGLVATGQRIARFNIAGQIAGVINASHELRLVGRAGSGIAGEGATTTWASVVAATGTAALTARIGSNITSVAFIAEVASVWTGASTTVSGDAVNFITTIPVVQGERLNPDGTVQTSYTTDTVSQRDVVLDLLGRMLPDFDGDTAVVSSAATYAHDQLAYLDGTTAAAVLDDLMALDPAFYWAAWEDTTAGKARFEFSAYPTSVAYEADTVDGFTSPGSAVDLYDRVNVRYVDERGIARSLIRTGSSPMLAAQGLSRTARVDLGSEVGSAAQAASYGDNFLASHSVPSNNGTLTIRRPIVDFSLGRTVQPWELRPGKLIRVRNVAPSQDSLNLTARDSVSIFFVSAVSYNAGDNAATLTLDSYDSTVAKALAKLAKRTDRLLLRK